MELRDAYMEREKKTDRGKEEKTGNNRERERWRRENRDDVKERMLNTEGEKGSKKNGKDQER